MKAQRDQIIEPEPPSFLLTTQADLITCQIKASLILLASLNFPTTPNVQNGCYNLISQCVVDYGVTAELAGKSRVNHWRRSHLETCQWVTAALCFFLFALCYVGLLPKPLSSQECISVFHSIKRVRACRLPDNKLNCLFVNWGVHTVYLKTFFFQQMTLWGATPIRCDVKDSWTAIKQSCWWDYYHSVK